MQEKFRKPYKAPRKAKTAKPKSEKYVPLAIKNYVRTEIKREDETKQKTVVLLTGIQGNVNGAGLNPATPAGTLINNILDDIALAPSTSQSGRIGNKIQNCSLRLTGFVLSLPYNATTNNNAVPFELHMLIYKAKDDVTNSPLLMLSNFGGTNVPIDGSVLRSCLFFNKDKYIIKKHTVFRLNAQPQISAAGSIINPSNNSNRDTYFRRFNINVPISKVMRYNDQSTLPSNDWVAVGFYYINGDGTTSTITQVRAQVQMNATLYFDDA